MTLSDGKVMINNATVTTPDLEAGNGVVHVIDTVLIPPTVVDLGEADPDFEILMDAIQTAGLRDTINDNGPFTVFAPINNAFQSLLAELSLTKEELLASPDLPDILKYHVVEGLVCFQPLLLIFLMLPHYFAFITATVPKLSKCS